MTPQHIIDHAINEGLLKKDADRIYSVWKNITPDRVILSKISLIATDLSEATRTIIKIKKGAIIQRVKPITLGTGFRLADTNQKTNTEYLGNYEIVDTLKGDPSFIVFSTAKGEYWAVHKNNTSVVTTLKEDLDEAVDYTKLKLPEDGTIAGLFFDLMDALDPRFEFARAIKKETNGKFTTNELYKEVKSLLGKFSKFNKSAQYEIDQIKRSK